MLMSKLKQIYIYICACVIKLTIPQDSTLSLRKVFLEMPKGQPYHRLLTIFYHVIQDYLHNNIQQGNSKVVLAPSFYIL